MPDIPRTVDDIRRAWRYHSNVAARDIGILLDVIDRLTRERDDANDDIKGAVDDPDSQRKA